jgi:hypothetical protein
MSEAVDEQFVKCAVVLTQLWKVLDDEGIADEPPFDGSNEVVHDVEPPLGSVCDVVDEAGTMAEVDHEPITMVVHTREAPFVVPEFMAYNDAAFGDEWAEGSDDDCLVLELSNWEKVLLQLALAKHVPDVPDRDLSQAHHVVADGFQLDDSVPPINLDNLIIQKGILFKTMDALNIWFVEYTVFHHCPFIVKNSDESKCYIVICLCGCPWIVCARRNNDTWRITSVVQLTLVLPMSMIQNTHNCHQDLF